VLFPIKKILNIDKYFVCESRDMSDESGTFVEYNSFKIKDYFVHLEHNIGRNTHISNTITIRSEVLCMGTMGSYPVVPQENEPHTNLCMLYTHAFFIFKH